MKEKITTAVDAGRCTGCGLCLTVCPSRTFTMESGKAVVTGDHCMACGHCAAVCPVEAVRVPVIADNFLTCNIIEADNRWLPRGAFPIADLVRLMRSRRSCRNYTDKPVDRRILEDLVTIGTTAPSGTNSQKWTFTILPDRPAVLALGNRVAEFFKKLNRLAENGPLRLCLKLFGKKQLDWYYRKYYRTVKRGLSEWEETGRDLLFHGATAAIVVGSLPGASCPREDALLATQNILLAAHSMGLGSCLIGYVVEAMKKDPSIKNFVNIPDEEAVYSVIALGYSNEYYQRPAGRKKVAPRYFEGRDA